jgi:hypothetical protein
LPQQSQATGVNYWRLWRDRQRFQHNGLLGLLDRRTLPHPRGTPGAAVFLPRPIPQHVVRLAMAHPCTARALARIGRDGYHDAVDHRSSQRVLAPHPRVYDTRQHRISAVDGPGRPPYSSAMPLASIHMSGCVPMRCRCPPRSTACTAGCRVGVAATIRWSWCLRITRHAIGSWRRRAIRAWRCGTVVRRVPGRSSSMPRRLGKCVVVRTFGAGGPTDGGRRSSGPVRHRTLSCAVVDHGLYAHLSHRRCVMSYQQWCWAVPSERLSQSLHGIPGLGETRSCFPRTELPRMVPGRFSP